MPYVLIGARDSMIVKRLKMYFLIFAFGKSEDEVAVQRQKNRKTRLSKLKLEYVKLKIELTVFELRTNGDNFLQLDILSFMIT